MKVECGLCEFWQCDDKCKCKCHVAQQTTLCPGEDPLRTRVPVWRCPVCRYKFYSSEALFKHREMRHGPRATPEPLSRAPEIRYQLRNAHNVTCAWIARAGECTCVEWREALIAEWADLIRLLEHHHAGMLTEDQLIRGDKHYAGSKLYLETKAALKEA